MADRVATASQPSLVELVEPHRWQRLQDHFAAVLGIAIRTVNPSRELLVNPSWPSSVTPGQLIHGLNVGEELEQLLPAKDLPTDGSSLTTTLGVTYACVPIRVTAQQVVAYFVIGPMIVGSREDELQFRQRVSAMKLDGHALWALLLSLKLYTFSGIRSVLNLMEEVGTSLVQFACQAKQLRTIVPATSKVDHAVVAYHIDRVLNSLLEAAALATRAEGGSVMVYDERREVLQIKVAQGLSDEIVSTTRLRRGEGLAGLAVGERSILLIDEQMADQRAQQRMHRKELASSLIAPLTVDSAQEPFGVLSLRTTNSQRRFTKEHIELLRRLLDIASVALGNLSFNFSPRPSA